MLKFQNLRRGILVWALVALAGCGGDGLDHLGYQRSVWAAKKPISYRYKINYGSWVDSCHEMQVVVTASGEPQVTMTPDCSRVSSNAIRTAVTMEKVFEVEAVMLGRAKNPTVIFDPAYGFPTRVYWSGDYNYYEQLNLSDFEVLSPS